MAVGITPYEIISKMNSEIEFGLIRNSIPGQSFRWKGKVGWFAMAFHQEACSKDVRTMG